MLTHLLVRGLLAGAPEIGTGEVVASADRTVILRTVASAATAAAGLPVGAIAWPQQYDPADHAPYAMDFAPLLASGEKIAAIEAISMNATAALLSVGVDQDAPYAPIIDTAAGQKVQIWFLVDPVAWASVSFSAAGVMLPVTVRVLTDSVPPKRYERTALLTVRQL